MLRLGMILLPSLSASTYSQDNKLPKRYQFGMEAQRYTGGIPGSTPKEQIDAEAFQQEMDEFFSYLSKTKINVDGTGGNLMKPFSYKKH